MRWVLRGEESYIERIETRERKEEGEAAEKFLYCLMMLSFGDISSPSPLMKVVERLKRLCAFFD